MRRLAAIAAGVGLILTGCAAQGSAMKPDAAEQDARDVLARTSAVVPAGGWTTEVTWGPCEKPREGHVQLTFVAQSLTERPEPTPALAQAVVDAWQLVGRKPTVTSEVLAGGDAGLVVSDPTYLTGANPDGTLTQLSLSSEAIFLQVMSPCIEGDLDHLLAGS